MGVYLILFCMTVQWNFAQLVMCEAVSNIYPSSVTAAQLSMCAGALSSP